MTPSPAVYGPEIFIRLVAEMQDPFEILETRMEDSPANDSWSFFSQDVVDVESPNFEEAREESSVVHDDALYALLNRILDQSQERILSRVRRRSKSKTAEKSESRTTEWLSNTTDVPVSTSTKEMVVGRTLRPYSERRAFGFVDYPATEGEEFALLELFKRTLAVKRQLLGNDDADLPQAFLARRSLPEPGSSLLHILPARAF